MRIAQIAPIALRVPPQKYGGTERIVYTLTEELIKKGHDVTLFATGDSLTSAKLISFYPQSLVEEHFPNPFNPNPISLLHVGKAYEMQDKFDIIHDHLGYISLPFASQSRTPVVMTLHSAFNLLTKRDYDSFTGPFYVSISNAQRKPIPYLNYIGTVYHGLNMETYPFSEQSEGYLLYVGRITEAKGVHQALTVAKYLNLPLILAGKVDPDDIKYFEVRIKPFLNQKIQFIGEVNEEERNQLMSKALAFLHPVMWREPFGLTLIESMACGCPVIAFRRGSIPEIIKHGKTGFIVEDTEEMVYSVTQIEKIKRIDCRRHVLENFNAIKMSEEYEKIYKQIIHEKLKQTNTKIIQNSTNHYQLKHSDIS